MINPKGNGPDPQQLSAQGMSQSRVLVASFQGLGRYTTKGETDPKSRKAFMQTNLIHAHTSPTPCAYNTRGMETNGDGLADCNKQGKGGGAKEGETIKKGGRGRGE